MSRIVSSELRILVADAEIIDARAWLTPEDENMLSQVELSMLKAFKHLADAIVVFAEQEQRRWKRRREQQQRWMEDFGCPTYDQIITDDPVAAVFKEARIVGTNLRGRDAFPPPSPPYLFENNILDFDLNSRSPSLWEVLPSRPPQTHQQEHQQPQQQQQREQQVDHNSYKQSMSELSSPGTDITEMLSRARKINDTVA